VLSTIRTISALDCVKISNDEKLQIVQSMFCSIPFLIIFLVMCSRLDDNGYNLFFWPKKIQK
jgi:hypothetical protein